MYDPEWEGPHLIWPPYGKEVVARGTLDARQARQVRAQYGAKLTMIDHWFGKVLEQFDRHGLWDTTALIVCTDHGHYLGEHDYFGKPPVPVMATLGHIPLFVHVPGMPDGAPQAGPRRSPSPSSRSTSARSWSTSRPHPSSSRASDCADRVHGRGRTLLEGVDRFGDRGPIPHRPGRSVQRPRAIDRSGVMGRMQKAMLAGPRPLPKSGGFGGSPPSNPPDFERGGGDGSWWA